MATEFGGNWLDFRHFETNNSVDRARFPSFNNDLREAMFQEPIRLMEDVIHNDRSVLDLLYGDYTFVNPPLAMHYGMPQVTGDGLGAGRQCRELSARRSAADGGVPDRELARVAHQSGEARLLGGEAGAGRSDSSASAGGAGIAQRTNRNRICRFATSWRNIARIRCARRVMRASILSGLAFEGYGPVGEARTKDLAGRPIDIHAVFPGGSSGAGLEGVRTYIREHRQAEFVDNLSRKLLAYALNRSLQLSDQSLIGKMETRLRADGYRFDSLVETIVTSPPFLNKRNPDAHQTLSQVR